MMSAEGEGQGKTTTMAAVFEEEIVCRTAEVEVDCREGTAAIETMM